MRARTNCIAFNRDGWNARLAASSARAFFRFHFCKRLTIIEMFLCAYQLGVGE